MADPTWDFRDPASKPRLLRVLKREIDEMFELVRDRPWNAPTACEGWEVRDMVGHLVDATEGYLSGLEIARSSAAPGTSVGVAGMAAASDAAARAFRSVPRADLLDRFGAGTDRLLEEFEALSESDWSGLVAPEPYLGPLPAMFIVEGLLGGYAVHGWDVREPIGAPHAIAGDTADLLVPFVFLLWWATADTSSVERPYTVGVRTTGINGGDTRIEVSNTGLELAPGNIDDCPAVLELDPATLVLVGYGRVNGGTVRGDRQLAREFLSLFVSI